MSEEPVKFILDRTLQVINKLESDGTIGKYAIGGAIGAIFFTEATTTYDLDIFCFLPTTESGFINLGPLYGELAKLGYQPKGTEVLIEGVPVQFLIPPDKLEEEALAQAEELEISGVKTRVFSYEHLLAIMAKTSRPKDKVRITQCLDCTQPDEAKLKDILTRYDLVEKWAKITA